MTNGIKIHHALLSAFLLLSACSESPPYDTTQQPSPNIGAATTDTLRGVLLDSVVSGVRYDAGNNVGGVTDVNGSFEFFGGQAVRFYIGDMLLGTAFPVARPANIENIDAPYIVTPIELAGTNATLDDIGALNRVRLLMALDDDANPENGISISAAVAQRASENPEITFTQNDSVEQAIQFIQQGTGSSRAIPDANVAREHLCTSLRLQLCEQQTGTDVPTVTGTDTVETGTDGGETTPPAGNPPIVTANTPPVITGSPQLSVTSGDSYYFLPSVGDADGDNLSFSISAKPVWAKFDKETGALTGTPDNLQAKLWESVSISVTDGIATSALRPFNIRVIYKNTAPTITGTPPSSVAVGQSYTFTPASNDIDGDGLSFTIAGKPSWATFDPTTGSLTGTPATTETGTTPFITISVSDGSVKSELPSFKVTVSLNNTAPVISGTPSISVASGSNYSFVPQGSDTDGDSLTFSIANKPAWATFNTTTGELNGSPDNTDTGTTKNVTLSVTDGESTSVLSPFDITVTLTNKAPDISGNANTVATTGELYLFEPSASDANGDSLVFSVSAKPNWASFDVSTGRLSGTPVSGDQGSYTGIVISVTDGNQLVSLPSFGITVGLANLPPIITGTPDDVVAAGDTYQFLPTANDGNGDSLVFEINNKPGWADFNQTTGELSGLPANNDAGTYDNIVISVSDGTDTATLAAFTLTVTYINQRPQISGSPALSIDSGDTYTFTPTASDGDGDTLFFSVNALPGWASFDSSTGTITGTPGDHDARTWEGITITVADGLLSSVLTPFSITVTGASNPPQISGTPGTTAVVGQAYAFTPTVHAHNCDILMFNVANLPAWASFNTDSGAITGTPTSSDLGTTTGLTISVDAGEAPAVLDPFNLTVVSTQ